MNHPAKDAAELAWRFSRTRNRITELEEMAPGQTMLAGLMALRGELLDAYGALRVRVLWQRVGCWVAAQTMVATNDAINAVGHLPGLTELEERQMLAQEIAAATNVAYVTASDELELTTEVAQVLPQSWVAMDKGQLSLAHVRALSDAVQGCPPRVVEAIDAQLIARSVDRGWTPSRLRKEGTKLVLTLDPDGAAERAAAAKSFSDVRFRPEPNEMATVASRGDAVTMRSVMDTINDRAEELGRAGDGRSVGLRRIAALAEAVLNEPAEVVTDEDLKPARTRRPWRSRPRRDALVRLDLTTYLRQDDKPGELDGYGAITAETARLIAADASLRRLITDRLTGQSIDLGRTRYRPSQALRDLVIARDITCRMAGCNRPARDAEVDHRLEHGTGGRTDADNLDGLCPLHHDLKTKKLWHVDHNPDGTYTWRSALGLSYIKRADQYSIEVLEPPDDDHLVNEATEELLNADPDPPRIDDPLPDTPPLTIEEYLDYCGELERECYAEATRNYNDIIEIRSFRRAS